MYVKGTSPSVPFRSETVVQMRESDLIVDSHSSLLSSTETPTISNPFGLYFLYIFNRVGFSRLQPPHHCAQNSSNTYLPLKDESLNCFPLISGNVKSTSLSPTFRSTDLSRYNLTDLPHSLFLVFSDKVLNISSVICFG